MININMSSKKIYITKKLRILVKNHDYKHIQIVTDKGKIYSYLTKKKIIDWLHIISSVD